MQGSLVFHVYWQQVEVPGLRQSFHSLSSRNNGSLEPSMGIPNFVEISPISRA